MKINEQEPITANDDLDDIDDIVTAMDKNQLNSSVQNDVIGVLYSLKGEALRRGVRRRRQPGRGVPLWCPVPDVQRQQTGSDGACVARALSLGAVEPERRRRRRRFAKRAGAAQPAQRHNRAAVEVRAAAGVNEESEGAESAQ